MGVRETAIGWPVYKGSSYGYSFPTPGMRNGQGASRAVRGKVGGLGTGAHAAYRKCRHADATGTT